MQLKVWSWTYLLLFFIHSRCTSLLPLPFYLWNMFIMVFVLIFNAFIMTSITCLILYCYSHHQIVPNYYITFIHISMLVILCWLVTRDIHNNTSHILSHPLIDWVRRCDYLSDSLWLEIPCDRGIDEDVSMDPRLSPPCWLRLHRRPHDSTTRMYVSILPLRLSFYLFLIPPLLSLIIICSKWGNIRGIRRYTLGCCPLGHLLYHCTFICYFFVFGISPLLSSYLIISLTLNLFASPTSSSFYRYCHVLSTWSRDV